MLNTHASLSTETVTTDQIGVGPLRMTYDDGNAGQRLSLTGDSTDVMPYWQVVANTRTGTDSGHAVAGYQAHLGPDDGGGINREFWYLEAVGENDSTYGPHFRMGTWASGTGIKRALQIGVGGAPTMIFYATGPQRVETTKPLNVLGGINIGTVSLLEYIQDAVAAMIVAGTGVTKTYDDGAGTLTISSP